MSLVSPVLKKSFQPYNLHSLAAFCSGIARKSRIPEEGGPYSQVTQEEQSSWFLDPLAIWPVHAITSLLIFVEAWKIIKCLLLRNHCSGSHWNCHEHTWVHPLGFETWSGRFFLIEVESPVSDLSPPDCPNFEVSQQPCSSGIILVHLKHAKVLQCNPFALWQGPASWNECFRLAVHIHAVWVAYI